MNLKKSIYLVFILFFLSGYLLSEDLTQNQALEHATDFLQRYDFSQSQEPRFEPWPIYKVTLQYTENPFKSGTYDLDEFQHFLGRISDLIEKLRNDANVKEFMKEKIFNINQLSELIANVITQISLLRTLGKKTTRPEESALDFNIDTDYGNIMAQIRKLLEQSNISEKSTFSKIKEQLPKLLIEGNYGLTYSPDAYSIENLLKERDEKRQNVINALNKLDQLKNRIQKQEQEDESKEQSLFEQIKKMSVQEHEKLLTDRLNDLRDAIFLMKQIDIELQKLSVFEQEKLLKNHEKALFDLVTSLRLGLNIILKLTLGNENAKEMQQLLEKFIADIESENYFNDKTQKQYSNRFQKEIINRIKTLLIESQKYNDLVKFLLEKLTTIHNLQVEIEHEDLQEIQKLSLSDLSKLIKDLLTRLFNSQLDFKELEAKLDALSSSAQSRFHSEHEKELNELHEIVNSLSLKLQIILKLILENYSEIDAKLIKLVQEVEDFINNKFNENAKRQFSNKFNEIVSQLKFKTKEKKDEEEKKEDKDKKEKEEIGKGKEILKKILQKYLNEFPNIMNDINQQDSEGKNLLRVATESRDIEAVKTALDLGADPKISASDGATVLHVAAEHNLLEPMKLILAKHPEVVDYQGNRGTTPLRIAVESGRNESAKLLLDNKANPNTKGSDGLSAADILKQGIGRSKSLSSDIQELLMPSNKILIKYKSQFPDIMTNINTQGPEGKNLLRVATESRDNEAVKTALDLGADPKISASDGSTVLHVAAEHNLVEPMQLILAKHPEVVDYQGNRGATPLRIAVENARSEAAKILLDSGANPNIKGSDGLSAADILKQGIGRSSQLSQNVKYRILKS